MKQSGFSENLIVQDSFFRLGGLSWTYYDIAEDAYALFLTEESNKLPKPIANVDPTESMEQDRRMRVAGIKTIVFAAMCIEAAAFDFASTQLGDSYAELYLDKLDLISKWVVIPKLVSGKSFQEAGAALNALRILVRARNKLVHQKSMPFDIEGKNLASMLKADEAFPNDVHNAFKAVVLLSLELSQLLGVMTGGLPIFEKHVRSSKESPPNIKYAIERCRVIHSGNRATF